LKILRAIKSERAEVLFGGKEVLTVHAHRISPTLFHHIVRRLKVT
jgi:hypothetical protein